MQSYNSHHRQRPPSCLLGMQDARCQTLQQAQLAAATALRGTAKATLHSALTHSLPCVVCGNTREDGFGGHHNTAHTNPNPNARTRNKGTSSAATVLPVSGGNDSIVGMTRARGEGCARPVVDIRTHTVRHKPEKMQQGMTHRPQPHELVAGCSLRGGRERKGKEGSYRAAARHGATQGPARPDQARPSPH